MPVPNSPPEDARILLVEDDESQRKVLTYVLQSEGYTLETAADAESAIDFVRSRTYDMVITDLKLPGQKDGIDVLLSAKDANDQTDVVVVSAFGSIDNAVQAMLNGALDYIQKPLNISEFRIKVRRALENRAIARKLDEAETRKDNSRMLLKQVREYREKLERIKSVSSLMLSEMNPGSPFFSLVKKIDVDASS
jgi:DNA-binding NtrC family response regulator